MTTEIDLTPDLVRAVREAALVPEDPRRLGGRPLTSKEIAESDAYKAAWADLTKTLGRTPTPGDDGYWRLPAYTPGTGDLAFDAIEYTNSGGTPPAGWPAANAALRKVAVALEAGKPAPSAPAEATAKAAPAKAAPAAPATPGGPIFVPEAVCRDEGAAGCVVNIERKAGAGRPPVRCVPCRERVAAEVAAKKGGAK